MDNLTKKQRKFCMSRIKSKNTQPEKIVRKILSRLGWRYRLHNTKLSGKPDIVISKIKTIFFINGCFWHQHKGCKWQSIPKTNIEYWSKKLRRNVEKQKEDIRILKKDGWKVNVIWECETKNENNLIKKLKKYCEPSRT